MGSIEIVMETIEDLILQILKLMCYLVSIPSSQLSIEAALLAIFDVQLESLVRD